MKVLILGGNGMLGHQFLKSWQNKFSTKVTLRNNLREYKKFKLFNEANSYPNIDILNLERLKKVFDDFQPSAVVNCTGITKQKIDLNRPEDALEINSLFPHKLLDLCKSFNSRLIILSTDCIF